MQSRCWSYAIYCTAGTSFTADMGFDDEKEGLIPGVSVFTKEIGGKIYRVSGAEFGPGDNFCPVWHFFDLLQKGIDGWELQLTYKLVQPSCAHEPRPFSGRS